MKRQPVKSVSANGKNCIFHYASPPINPSKHRRNEREEARTAGMTEDEIRKEALLYAQINTDNNTLSPFSLVRKVESSRASLDTSFTVVPLYPRCVTDDTEYRTTL
ncbi:hypothetical protein FRC18_003025 [Serendipita sp. 400]|nr:hypothetical protein FRC18_003025 [Serendipita sp. 400]